MKHCRIPAKLNWKINGGKTSNGTRNTGNVANCEWRIQKKLNMKAFKHRHRAYALYMNFWISPKILAAHIYQMPWTLIAL